MTAPLAGSNPKMTDMRTEQPFTSFVPEGMYNVGSTLKLSNAKLVQKGNMLEITGKEMKGTPLSMLGFNIEETVTEGTTPASPEDLERAMALVA